MSNGRELITNLEANMFNPSAAAIGVIRSMRALSDGDDYDFVDPNNPVIQLIETSVVTAYASIEADEAALRKTYASMATNMRELYCHMSDKDFIDPFAQPAPAHFTIFIGKNEIVNKAVPRDSAGTRKLVIPQDTFITVAGYDFTLQYPIEIRVMPHGGIQVVYDTTLQNPVRELESNLLEWEMVSLPIDNKPIEMVAIKIPTLQYKISSYTDTIVPGSKFKKSFAYDNSFFYARVYLRTGNKWTEVDTTHAERVIDPYKVTAQITVREEAVDVYIPDVYVRSGMAVGDVRMDIYTTHGELNLDLMSFTTDAFKLTYRDIGKVTNSTYYTPLETFSYLTMAPNGAILGGRRAMTFEELRSRVIDNNLGSGKKPISEGQLITAMSDRGYKLSLSTDYVTNRIYHASTDMLPSTLNEVSTPIGTMNGIVETTEEELLGLSTVRKNGNRITILPETAYIEENGLVKVDTKMSLTDYRLLNPADSVLMANNRHLLFTPFHYVLDLNNSVAECRAYYLDDPKARSRVFVETNTTLLLDVASGSYAIEKAERGYRLVVKTRSGKSYQDMPAENLTCQISFTPRGYNNEYAYLDGTLLGFDENNEAVFEFYIETNLDIDRNHDLVVTNFIFVGSTPTPIAMPLDVSLNLIFGVKNYTTPEYKQSKIDVVLRGEGDAKGVTHEQLRMDIGSSLDYLWTNVRTVVTSINYKHYPEDVYAYWTDDVRVRDPETGAYKYTIGDDGSINWVYEHLRGDPVLDEDGNHKIEHEAGTIMYGPDKKPIIERPESIGRRLDMFLFDARYAISNTEEVAAYLKRVTDLLISQITNDMVEVNKQPLEKTTIYLYPRGTMGHVKVLLEDGVQSTVPCENNFIINYYLSATARRNTDLIKSLSKTTRSAILECLEQPTISTTSIGDVIKEKVGDDVRGVIVSPMGSEQNINIMTVTDETSRLIIGKKLILNPDNTIGIADDITIGFNRHEKQ